MHALTWPFRFVWLVTTGTGFLVGLFVWILLGAACAAAVVLGAVLAIFFQQPEALWLVAFGIAGGGLWGFFTDAMGELINR